MIPTLKEEEKRFLNNKYIKHKMNPEDRKFSINRLIWNIKSNKPRENKKEKNKEDFLKVGTTNIVGTSLIKSQAGIIGTI